MNLTKITEDFKTALIKAKTSNDVVDAIELFMEGGKELNLNERGLKILADAIMNFDEELIHELQSSIQ